MPLDAFHLGIMIFAGLASAAALTVRAYQQATRNFFWLLFCAVTGFTGPIIGIVVLAPLMQASGAFLSGTAVTSYWPGFVSLRPGFFFSGFLAGILIASLVTLHVIKDTEN